MVRFWFDTLMLGLEAQEVIWLRSLRIAGGGKAGEREIARMVGEKVVAAAQATVSAASGADAASILRTYRSKVRANRRRLSR
jgi:hypothetical protein